MKTIGVLALQGAVSEHLNMLQKLAVKAVAVKHTQDLDDIDGLIIPGGESTAISRLIQQNQLIAPIQKFAQQGKAVLGTCAGLILCGAAITDSQRNEKAIIPLKLINITTERNGFGRQIDSFETNLAIKNIADDVPAVFIRAPYIAQVGDGVEVLATVDGHIVMAQSGAIVVASFHPELTQDCRVMQYFISLC